MDARIKSGHDECVCARIDVNLKSEGAQEMPDAPATLRVV
jgi:hypothetical protein